MYSTPMAPIVAARAAWIFRPGREPDLKRAARGAETAWEARRAISHGDPTGDSRLVASDASSTHRRRSTHVWSDKHWRWVPTADGDWRVQGYVFHHHHKPTKTPLPRPRAEAGEPHRAAAPARRRHPTRARPAPTRALRASRRRCGCCTAPASARSPARPRRWSSMGLVGAVQSLTRPSGAANLIGPPPVDDEGRRSPPPTPGATTTSGGSTGWSAPTSRWSSGWRSSSTTGSRPPRPASPSRSR